MEDFQNAFNDADVVFVAPVYPAGEEPIEGVDSAALTEGLRARGHRMVSAVADLDELCRNLRDLAADGDMIICMGAGDITKWAAAKTRSASDFLTAGGGISGFQNGLAVAGDYMLASTLLGVTSLIFLRGYDGFVAHPCVEP